MAEEKKPAAKKPAAKPAAKAPAKAAEKKPAAKAPAKAAEKKPAAKPAAKAPAKTTAAKAPASQTATTKPAAKAPAKAAAAKPAVKKEATEKPAAKATAKKAEPQAAAKADSAKAPAAKPAAKKAPAKRTDETRPSVVKLHHLRPAPGAKKAKTRVGRGEGSKGKTAGRGTKGTKARYQVRPGFEGGQLNSVMRAPKLRGFKNPFRVEYQVVNVGRLAELYPKGGEVTIADLVSRGAVRKNEKVKVLGEGELSVALKVSVDKVSTQAKQKIEKAGGEVR